MAYDDYGMCLNNHMLWGIYLWNLTARAPVHTPKRSWIQSISTALPRHLPDQGSWRRPVAKLYLIAPGLIIEGENFDTWADWHSQCEACELSISHCWVICGSSVRWRRYRNVIAGRASVARLPTLHKYSYLIKIRCSFGRIITHQAR